MDAKAPLGSRFRSFHEPLQCKKPPAWEAFEHSLPNGNIGCGSSQLTISVVAGEGNSEARSVAPSRERTGENAAKIEPFLQPNLLIYK